MLCLHGFFLKKRLSRREVASVWIWPCLSRYAVFLNAKVLYFNIRLMPVNLLKEDLCRYLHRSNDVVVRMCL